MAWTLTYDGTTQSLAAWSISGLRRRTRNQGDGQVLLTVSGPNFDSAGFAYGADVIIHQDATQWFRGRVTAIQRGANPDQESISYVISDAWWDLNQVTYQGQRTYWPSSPALLGRTPHVTMNLGTDGSHLTVKQMIEGAVNYAITAGVALQLGQILPDSDELARPPLDDVSSLTCAQIIQRQLRWVPNAVSWIDYATTPPTFHCRIQSKLTAQTLTIHPSSGTPSTGAILMVDGDITPRHDLQFPAVEILYEARNTVDGAERMNFLYDIYPTNATGQERGALVLAIAIQGYSITELQAEIEVQAIDVDSLEWWQERFPYLGHPNVVNPTVTFEGRDGELPNELRLGQIAPWMKLPNNTPGSCEEDTLRARVDYTVRDGGDTADLGKPYDWPLAYRCVTTDLASGVYSIVSAFEASDPIPIDMAQFLYLQCSALQWEGTVRCVEEECTGTIAVRHRLNLAGGMSAWATMAALVQEVTEDIDSGETVIRFGPPPHLQAQDLLEMLKVGRVRRRDTPISLSTGGSFGSGQTALGKAAANANGTGGPGATRLLQISDGARRIKMDCATSAAGASILMEGVANDTGSITIRTVDAKDSEDTPRAVSIREVEVCVNGVTKRMLVLGSAPYDPPT